MRKKAFLIPILFLVTMLALYGAIAIAGSSQPVTKDKLDQANELRAAQKYDDAEKLYNQVKAENPGSDKALEAQKQLIHLAIDKNDLKQADTFFNQMVTEYAENTGLDEAVYEIGKDYQYSLWNTAKANDAHKYNLEHFPDTKFGMMSNVEMIRSYLRDGKDIADAEVEKWLDTYKDQPDSANGIYLIAGAYTGNNKIEKGLQLYQYAFENYKTDVFGALSEYKYNLTKKDYDAVDRVANKLISSFSDSQDVRDNIRDLANLYRDNKDFSRAIQFYKAEIANWPDYGDAVVPYREAIYCYINAKDIENADVMISQMQTGLANNPKLARTNFDIGNYFLNEVKDTENALKVHQFNADNYPSVMEAMWSQAAVVWYYVRHDDTEKAEAEYTKLLANYANQETLPKEIFQIGDIYRDEKKNYEKAVSLYKYQLENWPNYGEPTDTYRKLACTYIDMDDTGNADLIIQQMQANCAKNEKLARTNFDIGNYFLNDANDPDNALKVHAYNANNYSDVMEAMWSQAALVWYHVRHGNQSLADQEYSKLLNVFKEQETLPKEIFQIADIYREEENYNKAVSLYKYELENWPEYGDPLDIHRKLACTYIDMKDITNADAVIEQIQAKFADKSNLARINFDIGNYFLNDANDPVNALKVHAYNADNCTKLLESMWSQAAIVWYYVRAKDNSKAEEAYAKLLDVFKEQETLPKEVFQIADIYTEVGNYAKAIELAEFTLETWPESEYKLDAQKSIVKAKFESDDFASAEQMIDELIADNINNNQLPQSILTFGQDYYNKSLNVYEGKSRPGSPENPILESDREKSRNYLNRSLSVWKKAISALESDIITADYAISAEYYHYAGTCNKLLGDYETAIEYYEKVVDNWSDYEFAKSVQTIIPRTYEIMQNEGLISGETAEKLIVDAYQQVIDRYPDTSAAVLAAKRIKRLQDANEMKRLQQANQNDGISRANSLSLGGL